MDIKEKRKWQAFLIRYVMEFGSTPVHVYTLRTNPWYGEHPMSVNPDMNVGYTNPTEALTRWASPEHIELLPLAFELIAANLTPKPRRRKITDNPKKGDLC